MEQGSPTHQPDEWDDPLDGVSPRRQAFSRRVVGLAEGTARWLSRHWLALINGAMGLFVGGAFLAPVLAYFGNAQAAGWLIHSYHGICDQIPSHSYYLFGHQVCLCERCLAIYSTFLLSGILVGALPPLRQRL